MHVPVPSSSRLNIKQRLDALSLNAKLALGYVLGLTAGVLMTVSSMSGKGLWIALQFPVSTAAALLASWLVKPTFDGLPRKERRRITSAPLMLYLFMLVLFVVLAALTATDDRRYAAVNLFAVVVMHSFFGAEAEPTNFPFERLRRRIGRAAPVRVAVLWCGLVGLLWFLQHTYGDPKYQVALLGATITLGAAGTVASLKVLSRARKLRTRLYETSQAALRSLEDLRAAQELDRPAKQQAARRAWDSLYLVLGDRIDTGFQRLGTVVLPKKGVRDLERAVRTVVDAKDHDPALHRAAVARLRVIRMACWGRTDTLA
ncbi:hypothetical protein [Streptomyces sp. NPDC051561]|uniref:hypothetical protein n=1 Tax=Streptomyces sp. NPDC051561 TaxID=3365658 RepID=UPI0037A5D78E